MPYWGGFLEAQTALIQQGRQLRRARHRQAREQRGQKIVYTVNGPTVGDPNTEGLQRLKLVKRPTERDIFWDECRGESLDLRCLLQPSPPPALLKEK